MNPTHTETLDYTRAYLLLCNGFYEVCRTKSDGIPLDAHACIMSTRFRWRVRYSHADIAIRMLPLH
jgi:hypothetical protein